MRRHTALAAAAEAVTTTAAAAAEAAEARALFDCDRASHHLLMQRGAALDDAVGAAAAAETAARRDLYAAMLSHGEDCCGTLPAAVETLRMALEVGGIPPLPPPLTPPSQRRALRVPRATRVCLLFVAQAAAEELEELAGEVQPPADASCAVHAAVMAYARSQRATLTQWLAAAEARMEPDEGGSPLEADEAPPNQAGKRRRGFTVLDRSGCT